ncbi:PhoD-like phosphatase [Gracilaria domingensis]|nr:PhoD-like phosphatase [Gracilaria domingensis]
MASVTTYPGPDSTRDIQFAFSSCQKKSSDDKAFQEIYSHFARADASAQSPAFFMIHMGDLHYADIAQNDILLYRNRIRQVVSESNVHRLMNSIPMSYMYDDHDYGRNNAGFSSPSREAALRAYRKYVPSYALPSENASYHAFSVGRVRVIVTDLRALAMKEPNSTVATEQRQWLFSEFATAANYSVLVWMSSKPWIARSTSKGDSWGGFASERRAIADELVRLNVTNLIMIAGDAHMLAADNGSNSDYAKDGGAGFPVLQAAPLAHFGTSKGGPYSSGCFAYRFFRNRQYGLMKLSRLSEEGGPCIRFEGYKSGENVPKILFERCGKLSGISGSGGNENGCSLPMFPVWVGVIIGLGATAFVILCAVVIMLVRRKKKRMKSVSKENVSSADGNSNEG